MARIGSKYMFNIKTKDKFPWESNDGYCGCESGNLKKHSLRFRITKIGDSDLIECIINAHKKDNNYTFSGYINGDYIKVCQPALGEDDRYHWSINKSWDIIEVGSVKPMILICRKK